MHGNTISHHSGQLPRWRWLSFLLLLALFLVADPAARAQTKAKGPMPDPGGPLSGPNSGWQRLVPAIGFTGETTAQTHGRILYGSPKVSPTLVGTEVKHGDSKPVMLMLHRQDKDQRGVLELPAAFKNGFLFMHVGPTLGPLAPIHSTVMRLNVPSMLEQARKLNLPKLSLTFLSFRSNRPTFLTVELHFEWAADIIRLKF
ncbi:MAG: hypothetical protein CMJ85_10295 [Planctomycetes bacterium]|jgi:hypothetical protein|nr:hypothetical protein [Planctomycetota bacterium]